MKKAVICEFGDSHDDILYGQFEFLKLSGFETHFVGNFELKERLLMYGNVDKFNYLDFKKGQLSNFLQIVKTWNYIRRNNIKNVVLNTIEGTPVRNFCLFPFGDVNVCGVIHNGGNLQSKSTTFQKIIIPKIKKMYTLNPYIWNNIGYGHNIKNQFIYPLKHPKFNSNYTKPNNQFNIVIPGLVESERRDYMTLLQSLKGKQVPENIKFVLLGRSMHKKGIGKQIKEFLNDNSLANNFIIFDDYVDNNTFNSHMSNADLLLTLIHPGISNFDNYSKNKTSGTFLLSFSYKIPMLNHSFFKNYEDINIASVFYEIDELFDKILYLSKNSQEISKIKQNIQNNVNFDFEHNRKKYIKFLE